MLFTFKKNKATLHIHIDQFKPLSNVWDLGNSTRTPGDFKTIVLIYNY